MDSLIDGRSLKFREFVARVNARYQWFRFCLVLAALLERVADGEIKRLMVFIPPRHGKSELISRLFAAYFLFRYPHRWVGICSYAADLAYTLSRAARENYQRAGGKIKSSASAVKHWETDKGGGLWAAGVGGPITGKGWHLGIIDDPLKNAEDAASETIREKQKEWYRSTFYTREEPWSDTDHHGALVVIQTRWHEDDLSGWLLSEEEGEEPEAWHIVSFEAIKEEELQQFPPTCTVEPDWRAAGEALCPERRPVEKLRRIARRIGSYFWNALYQQKPKAREGGMFKYSGLPTQNKDGVAYVPPRGEGVTRVRYWDLGGSDSQKADYSAGVLMSRTAEGVFTVEDVRRGQWSPKERNAQIRATAEADQLRGGVDEEGRPLKPVTTWIEKVPGLAVEVIDNIVRVMAGLPVKTEMAKNDKTTRADPLADQCEAGNVRVVKAPWNRAYLEEMTSFPNGKNDDQVDGSSGAFSKLSKNRKWEIF
jgi:predicted phage terminase large subunit-like protein